MRLRLAVVALLAAAGLAAPTETAAATAPPTVAVVGDSYAAGWTGTDPLTTTAAPWYRFTAADLGWQVGNVVADPGAGYVQPGAFGTLGAALRAHPIPPTTDYVLLEGGLNDAQQDPALIPAAVADVLAVVHEQAPGAVPIVVGAFMPFPDHLASPSQVLVARAVGDYRGIGDTRYMIAFMCSFPVAADQVHPTAEGHHRIGDWVAWHIAHGLDNGAPLHLDPSGAYTA